MEKNLCLPDIAATNFALPKSCYYSRSKSWNKTRPRGGRLDRIQTFCPRWILHTSRTRHTAVLTILNCLRCCTFVAIMFVHGRILCNNQTFLINQCPGEFIVAQQTRVLGWRESHGAISSSSAPGPSNFYILYTRMYCHNPSMNEHLNANIYVWWCDTTQGWSGFVSLRV